MSKFSKKSLAVLTTAAIMASMSSVVAFAASMTLTVPNGLEVTIEGEPVGATERLNAGDELIVKVPAGKVVKVNGTAITDGKYVVVGTETALVFTVEDASSGSTPAGKENTDHVVWVNGKDVKGSKDGKTPAQLYKTESFDKVMMSAGGKWQVAVTVVGEAGEIGVEDFMKGFDDKGKRTDAKAAKEVASAKIKEGTVTVTAGKKAGKIQVWVYEIKSKKVVSEFSTDEVIKNLGVNPESESFEVKVAPGMVTTTEATKAKDGVVEAIPTAKKLEKGYKAGDEVIVYFGDKKNAVSTDATYVLWDGKAKEAAKLDESGKLVVADAYTAELVAAGEAGPAVKITIDAKATDKTKIDVQVKNIESGKVAKISPKVAKVTAPKEEKFTLTVADGIKVSVAGAEQTLTEGKIELAKGTKVTFDVDVTIGETDIAAGTEYEVTANVSVAIKVAA